MVAKPKTTHPKVLPAGRGSGGTRGRGRGGAPGRGRGGDPGGGTSAAGAGGINRQGRKPTNAGVNPGGRGLQQTAGGSGTNRQRNAEPVTSGSQRQGANDTPPVREPTVPTGGARSTATTPVTPPERAGGSVGASGNRGVSSYSSNPSSSHNTVSASRTSLPAQYPPSTQPPTARQFQAPVQIHQPPPPLQPVDQQIDRDHDIDLREEEEEDNGQFPDHDLDFGEEDEVEAPNPELQDFEQLLDDQMHRPGREQLVRLSEHPIPNVKTTW